MNRDDERIIEGMRRQSEGLKAALGPGRRMGWKAGFGTEGAMALIGASQPLAGYLTTASQLASGTEVDVGDWGVPLLEAEVAVRLGADLRPGCTPEQAGTAVDGFGAAIELVDLGSIESVEEILAGNIFHRRFLLGDFVKCGPGDLETLRISVTANDVSNDPSDPREVIGEIGKVLAALTDQVDLIGEKLSAGDVIITGAAVPPAPVSPGDSYCVEVNGTSRVSVDLA